MKPYPLDLAPILENFDKNATFWFRDHDLQFVALEKSKLYYLSQHGESFETVSYAFPAASPKFIAAVPPLLCSTKTAA